MADTGDIGSDLQSGSVEIEPIAGKIGAEVKNVDLSGDLDEEVAASIRAALLRYKVLFFRSQSKMTNESHERFAGIFGEQKAHPTIPVLPGTKYVLELDAAHGGRATSWHTDITFNERPFKVSVLRAISVPDQGGDTCWANTATAYAALPKPLQVLAESLWAEHSNDFDYAKLPKADANVEARLKLASKVVRAAHPVVHVHPESMERCLLLGTFFRRMLGVSASESTHLFEMLQGRVTALDNTVRWRWKQGDVAVWDNLATQHCAIDDYGSRERIMHRVSVIGGIPRSVDGELSRSVES